MKRTFSFITVFLFFSAILSAQTPTQTVRGTVVEQHVETPLPGANVIVVGSDPVIGSSTDDNGNFRLEHVPVGNHVLQITYMGYKDAAINILVNAGKETVVSIQLEQNVVEGKEVVVTADSRKDKPLNEMSSVSARTFSVEETQKYAAAVNDPARMALAFAGVVSADDGNNKIVIRGNAPNGLLWRMEGVDIPNPNHFSDVGTAGGGISILSSQLLANSDFITGAFAAEYGNALSGVFDLKLRKGNNERNEFTLQAGFLGLNVAAEGPFSKNCKGSYLVNYRYSTLSILSYLGLLDHTSVTNFQDLCYNIYLPTKKAGYFTLFGFGGLSDETSRAPKDSSKWTNYYDRYSEKFYANTGAAGFTHGIIINSRTYLKSALVLSYAGNGDNTSHYTQDYSSLTDDLLSYVQKKITLSSTLNYKFDSRNSLRAGAIANKLVYDLSDQWLNDSTSLLQTYISNNGSTYTVQTFAQWQFRLNDAITFNAGFHYLYLFLNNTSSVEPRAAVSWALNEKQTLSAAYGLVSQMLPIGVYFAQAQDEQGNISLPNKNLSFTKANHFVLSYDYLFSPNVHLKTEVYYQGLFNVPVDADSATSFSMLNLSQGLVTDNLGNTGTGKNYGVEFTLEKFLSKNYYALLSTSIYQSKYKGSDGVLRNTRYNGSYAVTFTAGKDFSFRQKFKNRVWGLNAKVIYSGGFRDTPIDLEASRQDGEAVYVNTEAFTKKIPDYFRTDVGISLKHNKAKSTGTWSLDIQNATNRQNVFVQYYDPHQQKIVTAYQTPLIPVLNYKIEF
ncbi:MAG TPA: TonB-dependent receptor [Chitinophagales bacterium]|nr:TonB-dependent receptor [Chitinophagales bacterium]